MALIDVPEGLQESHRIRIRQYLQRIAAELQGQLKVASDDLRVTSRLNSSETNKAVPVWVGTFEDDAVGRSRRFDAGNVRFKQSNRSKVYEETLNDAKWRVNYRDWTVKLPEKTENGYGPGQALGPREGFMHQFFIAIRVKEDGKSRHVGTITVGFRKCPDRKKVEPVMKKWAEAGKADEDDYVNYISKTFKPGGPIF